MRHFEEASAVDRQFEGDPQKEARKGMSQRRSTMDEAMKKLYISTKTCVQPPKCSDTSH